MKKLTNKKQEKKQKSFTEKVHEIVKKIPAGKVLTYSQVATKAGSPNAARAVGSLMKKNYDTGIPCHRVIRSDGKIGQYNRGGPSKKAEILKKEGYKGNLILSK